MVENNTNHVFTEIEINARPGEVWTVFSNWQGLKNWSSTFVGISVPKPVKGERFISYFRNPLTGGVIELEHVCICYEEGIQFGWSGELIGRAKDQHIYALEETPAGTTVFKQEDGLHGPHSKLLNVLARVPMQFLYNRFNRELKIQVEKTYARK